VLRDAGGEVHAHYNVCRHRGSRLCTERAGHLGRSLQCPYHAWTYALDGRLIGAPNMRPSDGLDYEDHGLFPVATAEWEGFIFLNFAADAQPFADAYAPLWGKFSAWQLPDLRVARRIVYDVRANWKLLFQNYSECYHCPTLHPALNNLTPYQGSDNDLKEGPFLGGPMQLTAAGGSMTMSGRVCASPLASLNEGERQKVYYYTLFPTMFLSLHPDYALTHRLEPLAVDHTRVTCEWLFSPAAMAQPDYSPDDAVEFWHMTNEQDWSVCELTQQGVSSRAFTPGPYADLEDIVAAFDRQYLKAMGN
jgi:Rieske 2Fe-2S family protein